MGTEGLTLYSPVVTVYTTKCNIQELYIVPIQYISVLYVDLRTNSNYFRLQHQIITGM